MKAYTVEEIFTDLAIDMNDRSWLEAIAKKTNEILNLPCNEPVRDCARSMVIAKDRAICIDAAERGGFPLRSDVYFLV